MTDAQKLKRHPAVILRRAMMHLRRRWESSRSANGRENIRILKRAVADVFQFDLAEAIKELDIEQRRDAMSEIDRLALAFIKQLEEAQ